MAAGQGAQPPGIGIPAATTPALALAGGRPYL